jgi:hypothetical protein
MRWSLLAALLAVAAAVPVVHAADPVQRVEIRLTVEGGEPNPLVVRRMLESIASAAERLLVGRDSEIVARQEPALIGVLREVVDRVVRGYHVVDMGLQSGAVTRVEVRAQPLSPILGEIPVTIEMPGLHPDAQPLVRAALERAMPDLRRLPNRLPVDALEWAAVILERQATDAVEAAAVGFTGQARVLLEPAPRLSLSIGSKDTRVIRDVGVRFRSTSIPSVLLSSHAPQVASMAEPLRGLPVVFATAHRTELETLIKERLAVYPPVRDYAIIARPVLQVAEVTYVTVLADSTIYRGRIEARLNFGTQAPPPDVRATFGRAFGSLEPFVEITLVPSNLALRSVVGLRVEIGTQLAIGASTGFDHEGISPFVTYRLSPDLQLRGKYSPRIDVLESTLSYRLNEFLSWEAVATSDGFLWLRLVSNL